MIDDFGGDNFDHSQLDSSAARYGRRDHDEWPPDRVPPDARQALQHGAWNGSVRSHGIITTLLKIQQHGTSAASRLNYLDLDPTYKDAWGQPLLRMTFDFP